MRPERVSGEKSKLSEYLRVLRRRKFLILAATVLVPTAAVLLALRQVPLYQATTSVLLSRQNVSSSLSGLQDPNMFYPERTAQTQADVARTSALARRVLDAVDLEDRSPGALLGALSVTPDPEADLLFFSIVDTSPALAERLSKAYAQEFTSYRRELDTAPISDALNEVESQIASLEGRNERDSPLYDSLVSQREQLRTIKVLGGTNAYVVEAGSAFQIQPQPFRRGVLGLILGFLLGIGLAFLRETLDTRLRSADEIGDRLGLPLLARLPEPPRRLRGKNRLAMLAEPHGVQAEAFRMLRTNLDFVNLDRGVRTIMITSAVQSEGKSTTAANLAVALARTGRRVILVDLDLRRPFLDRFFRLGGRPGITDVALGHAELDEAIASVAVSEASQVEKGAAVGGRNGAAAIEGTLEILPSGPLPPNPGEFVGSQTLSELVDELRQRADIVIVDAPPLLHVGDALTLSAKVDALLLVARLNVLRRPMLGEVQRVLETSPAAKLGFVLTGADSEEGYGYDNYYYRRSGDRERQHVG
jgi:capsular exopolysaccharide synthesis family protein